MPRIKNQNDAKMTLIEQTNGVIEKLNLIIQGYDIDYEEYFNRRQVGCVGGNNASFSRNVGLWTGHCEDMTHYGNRNNRDILWNNNINKIYFCSDASSYVRNLEVCKEGNQKGMQSYGQYQQNFWNVGIDTDNSYIPWLIGFSEVGDSDDRDLWTGPVAIGDPDNIEELYLISSDETKRILIRRKFVEVRTGWNTTGDQFTLQILKLRGFDAGSHHDFDFNNEDAHGIFDGKIDTWACDYAEGFVCKGDAVNTTLYSWYHLPANNDDGRANLLNDNISIDERNIKILPIQKPEYARADENSQINPYIKLSLSTSLTPHLWGNKLAGNISGFSYSLQTTFNTKTFYSK